MRSSSSTCHLPLATFILLLAFGLRLYGLNMQSLWYDETFMLYHARQGVAAAIVGLWQEDNALPLYGALLAMWIQLAGSGEFAARYCSVLVGMLAVPLAFRWGSALSGHRAGGWGAALALATLPIQVYYAQEVRMYALAVPLALAFALAAWRVMQYGRGVVLFVIVGSAMLLAHLYTALLWAALFIWSILLWLSRRHFPPSTFRFPLYFSCHIALGLAALPIAGWAVWRAQADTTAASAIPLDVLNWLPVQFGVGQYLPSPWSALFVGIAVLSIVAACAGLISNRRSSMALWVVIVAVIPVALLLALSYIKAKWDARYLLPSVGVGITVGAGVGWEMLRRQRIWLGVALAVMWVGITGPAVAQQARGVALGIIDEWHPRPDMRGVARYIAAHANPDDAIIVVGGYAVHNLAYYYTGSARLFGLPLDTRLLDTRHPLDLHALDALEQNAAGAQRLWLVLWQAHLADPTDVVHSTLVAQCKRLPVSAQFTNVALLLFDLGSCRPLNRLAAPPNRLDIDFAEPIRLLGYNLHANAETWELDLWWEASGPIEADYLVFTHLIGPDGQLIAQHDHIAGSDLYPTSKWTPGARLRDRFLLAATGGRCERCTLQVGLYNEEGRLPLVAGSEVVVIGIPP